MGLSTTTKGILASMLAAFFFTTMDVGAKTLIHLGTGEITFFRGLLGLLALPLLACLCFQAKTGCCSICGAFSDAPACCFSFTACRA